MAEGDRMFLPIPAFTFIGDGGMRDGAGCGIRDGMSASFFIISFPASVRLESSEVVAVTVVVDAVGCAAA